MIVRSNDAYAILVKEEDILCKRFCVHKIDERLLFRMNLIRQVLKII